MSATRATLAAGLTAWALAAFAALLWTAGPAPTLTGPAPAADAAVDRPVAPSPAGPRRLPLDLPVLPAPPAPAGELTGTDAGLITTPAA